MTDKNFPKMAAMADFAVANRQNLPFSIRLQRPDDMEWVEKLHARVFGPGRFARTAFRVREILPTDPKLCLVAEFENKRVGSVWMTPISLGTKPFESQSGCLLGPLAIDPDFRSRGLGKMLVRAVSDMALSHGNYEFVVLVGDEEYYGDMGFVRAKDKTIIFPGPVDPERILVCPGGGDHVKNLRGSIL